MKYAIILLGAASITVGFGQGVSSGQGTPESAFSYQGLLKEAGMPADGPYDMRFSLFDVPADGEPIDTIERPNVPVTGGIFTVTLDFGVDPFEGKPLFLEIEVRSGSAQAAGSYSALEPRQPLTPAPYAIHSANAPWDGITGVPQGFADDVDDDTVGDLACANGQVPKHDGLQWQCADDNSGGGSGLWSQDVDDIYNANDGNVGVGTSTPAFQLHVQKTVHSAANQPPGRFGLTWREAFIGGGGDEQWMYLRVGGSQIIEPDRQGAHIVRTSNAKLHLSVQDDFDTGAPIPQLTLTPDGDVGIGTASPRVKLHVDNGTDVNSATGGFIVTGDENALNIGIDDNEIMARDNGQSSLLSLNRQGGHVTVAPVGDGNLGVGTDTPEARVHIGGGTDAEPQGGGYLVIGRTNGTNVAFDNNEIMARNNGAPSTLFLNADGGDISCGGPLDIGYEIVLEVVGLEAGGEAVCPAGKRVLGGGCQIGTSREIYVNRPLTDGTGWSCAAFGDETSLVAYAICANVK